MADSISIESDWNALYIDGGWTESEGGETIAVEDPLTRETVAHVPRATEADDDAGRPGRRWKPMG